MSHWNLGKADDGPSNSTGNPPPAFDPSSLYSSTPPSLPKIKLKPKLKFKSNSASSSNSTSTSRSKEPQRSEPLPHTSSSSSSSSSTHSIPSSKHQQQNLHQHDFAAASSTDSHLSANQGARSAPVTKKLKLTSKPTHLNPNPNPNPNPHPRPSASTPSIPSTNTKPQKHRPLKDILLKLLASFQKRDTHRIFAAPVDLLQVPGYDNFIKNPMDFGTMESKVQKGLYRDIDSFKSDFMLVVRNAQIFNPPDTVFSNEAKKLEAFGEHAIAKEAPFAILPSSTSIPNSSTSDVVGSATPTSLTERDEPPKRKTIVLKKKNPGSGPPQSISPSSNPNNEENNIIKVEDKEKELIGVGMESSAPAPRWNGARDSSVSRSDLGFGSRGLSRELSLSNDFVSGGRASPAAAQRSMSPESARKASQPQPQNQAQQIPWTPSLKYKGKGPSIPKPAGIGSTIRSEATAIASVVSNKEILPGEGPEQLSLLPDGSIDITDLSFKDRRSLLSPLGLGTQITYLKHGAISLSGVVQPPLLPTPESLFPLPLDVLYRSRDFQQKQIEKIGLQNTGLLPHDPILASISGGPAEIDRFYSHDLGDVKPPEKINPLYVPSRLWGIKNPTISSIPTSLSLSSSSHGKTERDLTSYPSELPLTFPRPIPHKGSLSSSTANPKGKELPQAEGNRSRARERERERDREMIGNEEDWTILRTHLTRPWQQTDLMLYQALIPDEGNVGPVRSGIGPSRFNSQNPKKEFQLPMKHHLEGELFKRNLQIHLSNIPSLAKTPIINPSLAESSANTDSTKALQSREMQIQGLRSYQEIRDKVYGGGSLGLAYTSSLARFVVGAMKSSNSEDSLGEGWIEREFNERRSQKLEDERLYKASLKRDKMNSARAEDEDAGIDFMNLMGMGLIPAEDNVDESEEAEKGSNQDDGIDEDDAMKPGFKEYDFNLQDWTLDDDLPDYVRKKVIDPLTGGMHSVLFQVGREFSKSWNEEPSPEPPRKKIKTEVEPHDHVIDIKIENLRALDLNISLDSIKALPSLEELLGPLVESYLPRNEKCRTIRAQLSALRRIEKEKIEIESMMRSPDDLLEQVEVLPNKNERQQGNEDLSVIRFNDQDLKSDQSKISIILKQYSNIILKLAESQAREETQGEQEEESTEPRSSRRKKKDKTPTPTPEEKRKETLEEIRKGLLALVRNLPNEEVVGRTK